MYWFSVAGLLLDICGGFLLAVEAIKLENIRILRDRYLQGLFTGLESPRFIMPDMDQETIDEILAKNPRRGFGNRDKLYIFAHVLAGCLPLALVQAILWSLNQDPVKWLALAIWHLPIIWRVSVIVVGAIWVIAGTYLAGELVIHQVIANGVRAVMATLEAIARNTPTGTTGIIGFILLFLGFLGQLTGVLTSALLNRR